MQSRSAICMEVISHQPVAVNLKTRLLAGLRRGLHKIMAIPVILAQTIAAGSMPTNVRNPWSIGQS